MLVEKQDRKVSWLISDNTVTVNFDGQTHMLPRSDAHSSLLIKALKEKDWEAVPTLVSAAKRIEKFSDGKFQVRDGEIFIDGEVAPPVLGQKIQDFSDQGLPYEPLVRFAKKLQQNPSKRATEHLYQFLEKNNHPITESGNFIAYKKVRNDFMDCHSGTFDNSVGNTITMPRSKVDSDPNRTCSTGLHVANWHYAEGFGSGIMLEVEVNPADVVAIPIDYNQSKMRVCKYKVLSVVTAELETALRFEDGRTNDYRGQESAYCQDCGSLSCECEDCDY